LKIADSDFNLQALFDALIEMDCAGRIVCESPVLEEDALFMQQTWAKLTQAH
jgi:deoxyribonuclease-4